MCAAATISPTPTRRAASTARLTRLLLSSDLLRVAAWVAVGLCLGSGFALVVGSLLFFVAVSKKPRRTFGPSPYLLYRPFPPRPRALLETRQPRQNLLSSSKETRCRSSLDATTTLFVDAGLSASEETNLQNVVFYCGLWGLIV